MNPIFKNYSDSASQLLSKINQEEIPNLVFTYINPDAKKYCQLITLGLLEFSEISNSKFLPAGRHGVISNLVILDDGSTRVSEFVEYTDRVRDLFPTTKIVIATPVVPESEKAIFESICDTLIYLHSEPLFFEINQFYQSST